MAAIPAVPLDDDDAPAPKKRGRPPKGGETTKVAAEDEAAAEQLEDELGEAVVNEEPRKPLSSVKKGKAGRGRPKKVVPTATAQEDDVSGAEDGVEEGEGKQYWLMVSMRA